MTDHTPTVALYEEVAQKIRRNIVSGRYPTGRLPGQRELCRLYNVSPPTIKSAIELLEAEGIVSTRERSGVYLTKAAARKVEASGIIRCINMFLPAHFIKNEHPYWTVSESYLMGANHAAHKAGVLLRMDYISGGRPVIPDYIEGGSTDSGLVLDPSLRPWEQACIFIGCDCPEIFQKLYEMAVPFAIESHVEQRRPYHFSNHMRVWVDKFDGTARAVDHLVELGHRRIGYVGRGYAEDPDSWLYEQSPHDGFIEGMRRNGLKVEPQLVKQRIGWSNPLMIEPEVEELMSLPDLPSAIVTAGDLTAIHCIQLAHERGLSVPEDISVIGMNDQPDAATCDPPLTTMRTPHYEATRDAIETLVAPRHEPWREPFNLVFKCKLVQRATTAPPSASYGMQEK